MTVTLRQEERVIKETAVAAVSPGDPKNFTNLGVGIARGLKAHAIGDEVAYDLEKRIYEITALSTLTGSIGDIVEWDDTNDQIVANTAGDYDIGRLVKAKTSGQTTAWVMLNAHQ